MDFRTKQEWLEDGLADETNAKLVVIMNDHFDHDLCLLVMEVPIEQCIQLPADADMFDVLVACDFVKSKSQGRNCWTKTDKMIEDGLSTFTFGKKKQKFHIWKPINGD